MRVEVQMEADRAEDAAGECAHMTSSADRLRLE